jgi:hypothetical protein
MEKHFTQNGIHESNILCAECDNHLGMFDQYAYDVLHQRIDEHRINRVGPQLAVYQLGPIDVERFRLFLVALVWRAGISTAPVFQLVKLGPYEERLRDIMLGQRTTTLETITAAIILFRPPKYDQIMWSPYRINFCGANVIVFYMYPWKLLLKLDKRPFGEPLDTLALKVKTEAVAFLQDWWTPGELALLQDFNERLGDAKQPEPRVPAGTLTCAVHELLRRLGLRHISPVRSAERLADLLE